MSLIERVRVLLRNWINKPTAAEAAEHANWIAKREQLEAERVRWCKARLKKRRESRLPVDTGDASAAIPSRAGIPTCHPAPPAAEVVKGDLGAGR